MRNFVGRQAVADNCGGGREMRRALTQLNFPAGGWISAPRPVINGKNVPAESGAESGESAARGRKVSRTTRTTLEEKHNVVLRR